VEAAAGAGAATVRPATASGVAYHAGCANLWLSVKGSPSLPGALAVPTLQLGASH
jgi:hypothetical protein